jgi:hypothetical protein
MGYWACSTKFLGQRKQQQQQQFAKQTPLDLIAGRYGIHFHDS